MLTPDVPGHWGAVTSSVDWCESNYAWSPYVCELFNSISSLAMVVAGTLGFVLHRRTLEPRFLLVFLLVAVVGVGSVAFHGTLRFELQMLDELPMLYTVLVLVFALLENERAPKYGRWFPWALALYGALLTYPCAFTRGKLQFTMFQLGFGTLELFALYRVYVLYAHSRTPTLRRLYRAGMALYVLALLAWFTDIRGCSLVSRSLPSLGIPNPQLHAVWHVLVSGGLYLLILVIAFQRLETLEQRPRLKRFGVFVPYLEAQQDRALAVSLLP